MTKLSKAAFLSKYASIFADNVTRDISEEDVRDFRQDISDSFLSIDDNFIDEDDFTSDSATKAPSQQSTKAYVDGKTPFIWYQNTIDNSGGGTVLSTNSDKDIFQQFPVNFPNDGYFVTALVKIKAAAVQAGDEGNGYYSAEKIFTFYRDYAPEVSKKGEGVAVYEIGDDDLDIDMSADDGNVRLTIDTPAGDTYAWTVIAEITYSSIFYEV